MSLRVRGPYRRRIDPFRHVCSVGTARRSPVNTPGSQRTLAPTRLDVWSAFPDHTAMADQSGTPDYELAGELELADPAQYRALFDETRLKIIDRLLERASTTSQLDDPRRQPQSTVGHRPKVVDHAGLGRARGT